MEMLTPVTVRALLTENGIRPKKSLGQHFLADPNTARRVATLADVQAGDQVLEIGPGLGSLTLALLERGAHVRAVELDASLARVLESVLDAAVGPESDAVEVRVGDAYTIDLVRAARRQRRVVVRLQPSLQRRRSGGGPAARSGAGRHPDRGDGPA